MQAEQLQRFLKLCESDPRMVEFGKYSPMTVVFALTDQPMQCFLSFSREGCKAGVGAPPVAADVTLRATAAIMTGVLSGQVDGGSAVMDGRVALQGNWGKAEMLQGLTYQFARLYRQAGEAAA